MKKSIILLFGNILLLSAIISTNSCRSGNKETSINNTTAIIITGGKAELADESIAASGGEIIVDRPGDPLDGLSLAIVENDNGEDYLDFRISSSRVKDFDCGPYFNPITPLISISANGGDGSGDMILTVPVKVPAGQFAMPFLYNSKEKTLEGMSVVDSDDDDQIKIVISMSSGVQEEHSALAAQVGDGPVDANIWQIIFSSVDTNVLMKEHMTPFKPGVDDWIFTNYGSVADIGHCSGQSIGMLWYYSKKRLTGSPPLYGRFDNDDAFKTPKLWQDDVLGYKFCGTLQMDWNGIGFYHSVNRGHEFWQGRNDTRVLRSFAYALMVTNQPQLVIIYHPDEGEDHHLPHAMVVYGISGGTLFIADPNYPGNTKRFIEYDRVNHRYNPYLFGENATWIGIPYPGVHYRAKSATRTWMMASKRWKELENKTIGNGLFPGFTILALNDAAEYVPLTNGFHVDESGILTIKVECSGFNPRFEAYGPDGAPLQIAGGIILLPKRKGDQMVGICIKDADKERWVGFKWVRVKVGEKSGDEIKITTDWKPGTVKPPYGDMAMTIEVNGKAISFDTCHFNISEGRFWLLGPSVNIWRDKFEIECSDFRGEGEYKVHGEWVSNSYYPIGNFFTADGTMKVTKWRDGRLEGSFSFTGKEMIGDREGSATVTVTGSFNYKVPWHE